MVCILLLQIVAAHLSASRLPPHKRSADKAASTSEKVSSDSAFEGVQIVTENASEAIIAEDEKQRSKKPMAPDPGTCTGTAFA
jgi:hypothetical protein